MFEAQNQKIAALESGKESPAKSAPHYSSPVDRPDISAPRAKAEAGVCQRIQMVCFGQIGGNDNRIKGNSSADD